MRLLQFIIFLQIILALNGVTSKILPKLGIYKARLTYTAYFQSKLNTFMSYFHHLHTLPHRLRYHHQGQHQLKYHSDIYHLAYQHYFYDEVHILISTTLVKHIIITIDWQILLGGLYLLYFGSLQYAFKSVWHIKVLERHFPHQAEVHPGSLL